MSKWCYFCGDAATSRDHVPPKVFFPELKDLGGQYGDLRRQLVTVPSCAIHNGAQSKDDEYVAFIVMTSITNERIGADHFQSKYVRSLHRSPELREMLARNMTSVVADGRETAAVRIEQQRYAAVMERIARGLYFTETGARLTARIYIDTPCLGPASPVVAFRAATREHPTDLPAKWIGDPRVFEYSIRSEPFYLHMKFYGGFDVFVSAKITEAQVR